MVEIRKESSVEEGLVAANPYKASAGPEIDAALNNAYFNGQDPVAAFSTDPASAKSLVTKIEAIHRKKVIIGQTRTRPPRHFARLETDPSTSTEAMAESYPLAVARLALVLAMRRSSR